MAGENAPSLAEQYDVAPTASEVDAPASEGAGRPVMGDAGRPTDGAGTPAPEVPATPPRDPETGRFVSPQVTSSVVGEGGGGQPTPPRYDHSPTLVRLAFDLGITPEEIDSFDTPSLSAVVRAAQQERLNQSRESVTHDARDAGQQRAQVARDERQPAGPSAKDLGLDDQLEWDPTLLSLLKQLKDGLSEVAELKAAHVRQQQRTARQEVEAVLARDYADFMGPEPGPRATPRDPALAKRQMVAQYVSTHLRDDPGSLEDKLHVAMDVLFGRKPPFPGVPPRAAAKGSAVSEESWREGALATPTHRKGAAEPKGREAATQALASYMRENGLAGGGAPQQGLDEFLGD